MGRLGRWRTFMFSEDSYRLNEPIILVKSGLKGCAQWVLWEFQNFSQNFRKSRPMVRGIDNKILTMIPTTGDGYAS